MVWYSAHLQVKRSFSDLRSFIIFCSGGDKKQASRFYNCKHWLGLIDTTVSTAVSTPSSIVKPFCDLLEQNLQYKDNERDMVIMHCDINANFHGGRSEKHSCSMQLFGDGNMTAMCKTVGYTTAIGTKLILDGRIDSKGLLLPLRKEVHIRSLDLLNTVIFSG